MDLQAQKQTIPWLQRKEIGFFKALWETIKMVLFKPAEFFTNLEIAGSYSEPVLFYIIVATFSGEISILWNALFGSRADTFQISIPILALIMPIFMVLGLYLGSAITHLSVLIVGGKGGYKGTFNIFAYAIAAGIFNIIPFVGSFISAGWMIMIGIAGIKKIHRVGTVRAIFAYFGLFFIIIPTVAILAAIAIPNLLRVRLQVNEAAAEAKTKIISMAFESYKAANGKYPISEYSLRYAKPPYLKERYEEPIQGYKYSLNFSDDGYEIAAIPSQCGATGVRIFKAKTGGENSMEKCTSK